MAVEDLEVLVDKTPWATWENQTYRSTELIRRLKCVSSTSLAWSPPKLK